MIETDLLGTLCGTYFALRQFKVQGKGTLIGVSSVIGKVHAPYFASYAAAPSKTPKPISRSLHGVAYYLYVGSVAAAPALLGFTEEKSASTLCRVLSGGALAYTALTRAEWGFLRGIPFKLHRGADFLSDLFSLAAPWLFGFSRNARARNIFIGMGIVGLLASLLTRPEEMPVRDVSDEGHAAILDGSARKLHAPEINPQPASLQ